MALCNVPFLFQFRSRYLHYKSCLAFGTSRAQPDSISARIITEIIPSLIRYSTNVIYWSSLSDMDISVISHFWLPLHSNNDINSSRLDPSKCLNTQLQYNDMFVSTSWLHNLHVLAKKLGKHNFEFVTAMKTYNHVASSSK